MRYLPLLLALGLLSGCDTFHTVALSPSADGAAPAAAPLVVDHRCGRLSVTLSVWQGRVYDLHQTFDPTVPLTLHADSLVVEFAGERLPVHFVGSAREEVGRVSRDGRRFAVRGPGLVRTAFRIDERVNAGDTIRVRTDGYVQCEGAAVEVGPWTGLVREDIRGPFGT